MVIFQLSRLTIDTYLPALSRGGLIEPNNKIEGDGCTPLGTYPLREVWYRPDRVEKPVSGLLVREITPEDCWCDTPEHELYNRHFRLSSLRRNDIPSSFEHLWREDGAYDLIVVVGYNDDPPIPGNGSAIFIHCMHDDGRPTAGCVALAKKDLLHVISKLAAASQIKITADDISII